MISTLLIANDVCEVPCKDSLFNANLSLKNNNNKNKLLFLAILFSDRLMSNVCEHGSYREFFFYLKQCMHNQVSDSGSSKPLVYFVLLCHFFVFMALTLSPLGILPKFGGSYFINIIHNFTLLTLLHV